MPIAEYIRRQRSDGPPTALRLRVHVRADGVIDKVTPASMTISMSLAERMLPRSGR